MDCSLAETCGFYWIDRFGPKSALVQVQFRRPSMTLRCACIVNIIRSSRLVVSVNQCKILGERFFRSGCPKLGVENTVQGLGKFLMHYRYQIVVGNQLQASMELLVLEVRVSSQLFLLDYNKHHFLTTDCWLKFLWEKVGQFHLMLKLHIIKCCPPKV